MREYTIDLSHMAVCFAPRNSAKFVIYSHMFGHMGLKSEIMFLPINHIHVNHAIKRFSTIVCFCKYFKLKKEKEESNEKDADDKSSPQSSSSP